MEKKRKDVVEKVARKKRLNLDPNGNVSVQPRVAAARRNAGALRQKPAAGAAAVSVSARPRKPAVVHVSARPQRQAVVRVSAPPQRQAAAHVSASAQLLPLGLVKTLLLGGELFLRLQGRAARLVLQILWSSRV